ncbi:MAG TPA: MmcQ/YjbR family DNA-binding protein [Chloroflexota bacterium]|nr:MmcQ/YjbR family DNA-binding protein [Chloroflexota bacterium]
MITPAQFRAMVLAMPEAEEGQHHGHPDFRVRKKVFATLWPEKGRGVLMLPVVEHLAAVQRQREAYVSVGKPSLRGVTGVVLQQADADDVGELVVEAWCNVAPEPLVQEFLARERRG